MPFYWLSAEKAFEVTKNNPHARWPTRSVKGNNLYPNCKPSVEPLFSLDPADGIFAIGSCFARNIEEYLVRLGARVESYSIDFPASEMPPGARKNDLIVKYTPPSIYQELLFAFDDEARGRQWDLIVEGRAGRFYDLTLPTWFPAVSLGRAKERRTQINELFSRIADCRLVVVTLGLVECWRDNHVGEFITAAPTPELIKKYPGRFSFKVLSFDECMDYTRRSIELLRSINPEVQVVLTTSPVALGRTFTNEDVIVANAYSKSTLRSVSGEVAYKYDYVDYFPSYEVVIFSKNEDSWSDDLRHVKDAKVGEIMHHFASAYFPDLSREIATAEQRHAQAVVALSRGESDIAYEMLKSVSGVISSPIFINDYAKACEETGRYAEALSLHRQMSRAGDNNTQRLMRMANTAQRENEHELAVATAKSIIVSHPQEIGANLILIDSYVSMQNRRAALELASATLKLLQDASSDQLRPAWVYKRLANAFKKLGNADLAELVVALGKGTLGP